MPETKNQMRASVDDVDLDEIDVQIDKSGKNAFFNNTNNAQHSG